MNEYILQGLQKDYLSLKWKNSERFKGETNGIRLTDQELSDFGLKK